VSYQPPQGYSQQPPMGYGDQQPPQGYSQQPPVGYGPPPGHYGAPQPGHQGQPRRKRHRVRNLILSAAAVVVVIIVIGAVASAGKNGVTKDSNTAATGGHSSPANTSQSSQQQQSDNSTTGPIGTTFTVTDTDNNGNTVKYSVTLDKLIQHARPDNSFDTAPAGDHLAAAEFTIKGIQGDDQDDANNDASAVGGNNQTYQTGVEGLAAGTDFNSGQFNTSSGSDSVGWVSFEVKDGVTITSIQWSPDSGMSGDAPATWTVGS
jgi:hypothetical protein